MQAYSTEAIRNVALLSHSGAGKTSLAEAMLAASGAIGRLGQIADGNTTSDYEPEEVDRRSSIQTALLACEWKGQKINILDTPGYADFFGEVISALAAADLGLMLVSAVDGVEVGTESGWNAAGGAGLARMVVINKLDRENADFLQSLTAAQDRLGRKCIAVQLPQGNPPQAVLNLLDPACSEKDPRAGELREKLIEAAAETNDALTEKYLEEGDLPEEDLVSGLRNGVLAGSIVPVLATSATHQVGIQDLLDFILAYGPSPAERAPVAAQNGTGEVTADTDAPLSIQVFKTTADPYVGKLSFLRVFGGGLKSDSHIWNANKGQNERIGQVFVHRGKAQEAVPSLSPGDIGSVAKLQHTATGDTLCLKEKEVTLPLMEFLNPVYSVAIAPKTKSDMDKMGTSVVRLVEEDPSLRFIRDQESGETVLSGLGEAHIDVATKKLKRKFGVEVLVSTPRIPYRETIRSKTNSEYKHKKQTGGHGQYGHVLLELEPLPRGSGIEFGTKIVGGAVPREYIPAVEKGVKEAVQQGSIAGSKVVDLKVTLYDGSFHAVDSSNIAFQIAGVQAFRKGLQQGTPVLLEPIMSVKVTVPDSYTGDIMGDLNSKRARVAGTTPEDGHAVIEATVPLAEMQRYATSLRSMTGGRGSYSMDFSHYEEVPDHQTQKIMEEYKAAQGS